MKMTEENQSTRKKLSQSRYFTHTYWHGKFSLNETDLVDVIYSTVLRQLKRMDFLNHTKRCQIYFWQSSFPRKWQLNLYSSGMWHRVVWYIHINVYSEPASSVLITRKQKIFLPWIEKLGDFPKRWNVVSRDVTLQKALPYKIVSSYVSS